jgi:hypothetical protein
MVGGEWGCRSGCVGIGIEGNENCLEVPNVGSEKILGLGKNCLGK